MSEELKKNIRHTVTTELDDFGRRKFRLEEE